MKNPAIMSWNYAWTHFALDLYHSFSNYYRPVQMLTYMIDFSLWEFNPFGYHLTNVFLHICVCLTLFLLMQLMTKDARIAFVGTLFYCLHPAHTAVVTYIAGRADSLALLFMLLSLILFHLHFKARKNSAVLFLYIGSIILFLFALLSKEEAIILPALILLYRLFFISDDEAKKSRSIIKFHYISPFVIMLGVYVLLRMHALNFQEGVFLEGRYLLYIRLLTSLKAFGVYLGIIFMPLHLHMERYIPYVNSFFETGVLLSMLLFLFMVWMVVRIKRASKQAVFGFLFFIIALLPVMNIYPLCSNMAEHWLYVPMAGFSIFLSCLGVKFWDARRNLRPVLIFLLAGYFIFFFFQAFERNFDWRDEDMIYNHTYNYNPRSIKILNNLGNLYSARGNLDMAVMFHKKAIEVNTKEHKTQYNLGHDYEAMGMLDEALAQYELSARLNPDYSKAYFSIGNIYMRKKKLNEAALAYQKAVDCDEFNIGAHTNLGNIYFTDGNYERAKEFYENAVRINPYLPWVHNNLGNVLAKLGLREEAIAAYQKAIELSPDNAEYHSNLGTVYAELGMHDSAIQELERAYQLEPRNVEVLINLGAAYFYRGDMDSAKREWQKVLIIDPQNPLAKKYLGDVSLTPNPLP